MVYRLRTIDECYTIQFTYPKGKKRQFTGKNKEEVRRKVFEFFGTSTMTFRELFERWKNSPDWTDDERRIIRQISYGLQRYLEILGDKLAAEVTSEEILDAAKYNLNAGCKSGTINTQIRTISRIYRYGIEKGLLNVNPAAQVKRFRRQEVEFERYYLTDSQIYEFLEECRKRQEYLFAVYLICGIECKYFIPLEWGDVDFERCRIHISKRMEKRQSKNIVDLERTEKVTIEEPRMAFDFLRMELKKQAAYMGASEDEFLRKNRTKKLITSGSSGTNQNTSCEAFKQHLDDFLRRKIRVDYRMGDIAFTSAVYAFKAECDLPSVASIIGYHQAIKMFRHPEKYDLFERTKSRKVTEYFDELYRQSTANHNN
jgi:integrase